MNGDTGNRPPDEALRALLEELGGLRNANARDPVFKAWRQNTLTLIQRVWQMDSSRAERFRRVPFSPSSSKASATVRRQYFERGCSEAIWLLRDWIEDARRNGLSFAEAERPSAPSLPGTQEDDFPVLDLPANGSAPPAPAAPADTPLVLEPNPSPMMPRRGVPREPGSGSEKPRPPLVSPFAAPVDLPPADPAPAKPASSAKPAPPPKHAAPEPPPAKPAAAAKPAAPPPEPIAHEPGAGHAPARGAGDGYEADLDAAFDMFMKGGADRRSRREAKRDAPKRALKDMLGFTDDPNRGEEAGPVAEVPAPAAVPAMDTPGEAAIPPPDGAADDAAPCEIVAEEPAAPEPPLPSQPVAEPPGTADDEAAAMQEFLDRSPVLGARPKPAPPRPTPAAVTPPPAPLPMRSPEATAIATLASEVGRLGVPEGQQAAVRAMLLDLARGFDDGRTNWDAIRHAVVFAMEYPPLARRVLPLLVPHLDRAA